MKAAATLLLLWAAAAPVLAAQPASSLGLRLGSERLSNGSPDWHEHSVQFTHRYQRRQQLELGLTRTERFGLRDAQWQARYSHPLGEQLTVALELARSSTHRVLARNIHGATLQFEFQPGWLVHGGLRRSRHDSSTVDQSLLMLERYVGSVSFAAAWRGARVQGSDAHVGELRAAYYYDEVDGDSSSVGLILAAGREAESVAGNVLLTSVRSLALVGRHRLSRDWGLDYSIGHTRQGGLYTRNGVQLGVRYIF